MNTHSFLIIFLNTCYLGGNAKFTFKENSSLACEYSVVPICDYSADAEICGLVSEMLIGRQFIGMEGLTNVTGGGSSPEVGILGITSETLILSPSSGIDGL